MQDHPSLLELLAKTERDVNILDTLEKFKVHFELFQMVPIC